MANSEQCEEWTCFHCKLNKSKIDSNHAQKNYSMVKGSKAKATSNKDSTPPSPSSDKPTTTHPYILYTH